MSVLVLLAVRPAGAAEPSGVDPAAPTVDDRRVVSLEAASVEEVAGLTTGAVATALVAGFGVHVVVRRALAPLRAGGSRERDERETELGAGHGFGRTRRMAP